MIKNLESIKEKIDIVEVIMSFLPLKQVGGNFSACCPFHNEKKPELCRKSKQANISLLWLWKRWRCL